MVFLFSPAKRSVAVYRLRFSFHRRLLHATTRFHSTRARFSGGVLENTAVSPPSLTSPPRAAQFRRPPLRSANAGWFIFSCEICCERHDRLCRATYAVFVSGPSPPAHPFRGVASEIRWKKRTAGGARAHTHAQGPRARSPGGSAVTPPPPRFARARRLEKNESEVTLSGRKQGKPVRERVSWRSCGNTALGRISTATASDSRQNQKSNRRVVLYPPSRIPAHVPAAVVRYVCTLFVPRPICSYWN